MRLRVTDVHEDPELQLRDGLDMDRVKAMEEFEEQGGQLPPITVVSDDNILADGHHRLYLAVTSGRLEIDAERVPGDKAEAVALAIQLNDLATTKPLTRTERNKGVKLLLAAGWTLERVAKATGVHHTTIGDIATAMRMRGVGTHTTSRKAHPKPVAVLPVKVHERLGDTVLGRVADLPVEQQAEFAAAVASVPNRKDPSRTGLSEPRIREAVKAVKAGASIAEAVQEVTPGHDPVPRTLSDVTTQAYRRIDRFLSEPMTVMEIERDFWQVLDVLVANRDDISAPALGTLVSRLAEVAVRCDHYAGALQTPELAEAVS